MLVSVIGQIDNQQPSTSKQLDKKSNQLDTNTITDDDPTILSIDKIKQTQSKDSTLSKLLVWKTQNKRPDWCDVSPYGKDLKYYWYRWDSLVLTNDILYRLWESNDGDVTNKQIPLPSCLRKEIFLQLHNNLTWSEENTS